MKFCPKSFLTGFIICLMLFSAVFAESVTKTIEVLSDYVTVFVNGKKIDVENFVLNGTTYIPLRAVSESLGLNVSYEDTTKTVNISSSGSVSGNGIIKIGDSEITTEKFVKTAKLYYNADEQSAKTDNFKSVTDYLVSYGVLLDYAANNNINLTEEELKNAKSQYDYNKSVNQDNSGLIDFLSSIGLTEDEYYNDFYLNDYLLQKTYNLIQSNVIKVSDADIIAEYTKNLDVNYKGEFVKAKHILIRANTASEATEDIAAAKTAKEKILDVQKRIKNGEDFDKLMNELSEDPGTKTSPDGYTFGRGEMVKEFEDTAFKLNIDEISDVVETQFGYHIIKTLKKYDHVPLEMAKQQIEANLANSKFMEFIEKYKAELGVVIDNDKISKIKF